MASSCEIVEPFVFLEDVGASVEILFGFPCIFRVIVAFPVDQVSEGSASELAVFLDVVYLIFFFSIDKVRWRFGVRRAMDLILFVR